MLLTVACKAQEATCHSKGLRHVLGAEQVAVDAHVEEDETLKAEVPHREPEAGQAKSLGQSECISPPLQEGHAKDIETGCVDAASSASSAADQGAEPEQRGAAAAPA